MSDMRLIVAGAGGRMGRALTRVISETPGAVLTGALEAPGSELLGKDAGVLAGLPANGVELSADLWSMSANADGILDFTVPGATIANVAIAAQRGLVHVIGTTGLSSSDEAVIKSVTSRAIVVQSGNMSLGVNLLAALVKRVAQSLDESFDIEILEMHHKAKIDAPSGTALMLGQAAAAGRGMFLGARSARGPGGRTGRAKGRRYRLCRLARRQRHRRSQRDLRRPDGAHRDHAPGRGSHHVRARRRQGRAVGASSKARAIFHDRRAGAQEFLEHDPEKHALGPRPDGWEPVFRRDHAQNKKIGKQEMSDRLLVLVRHGQSEWNLKNLFTGWKDPDLTEMGIAEAKDAGGKLKAQGLQFDIAFTSVLLRAQHTLDLMLAEIGQTELRTERNLALNERDYGDLSGLNKDDARKKWGEEQVLVWRRSYDVPPPGGESLKDTLARTLPYYVQEILPCVLRGERTLVAAHGNSLRALIMVLEKLSPKQILARELATGARVIYRLNADATVASKLDLA